MYSQNNEEKIFKQYFKDFKGRLLEIGANDGQTLSNSYGLLLEGWGGVLVEPSLTCLEKLNALHRQNTKVKIAPFAIGTHTGEIDFYESETLLNIGDTSLVSTTIPNEMKRWDSLKIQFNKKKVDCVTFADFLTFYPAPYHLISIDAEGLDYEILTQMNLITLGCKMICVETNGLEVDKYAEYIRTFGFKIVHRNAENLIMAI